MEETAKTNTDLKMFDHEGIPWVLITQTVESSQEKRESVIVIKASDFEDMFETYQESKATAQQVLRTLKNTGTQFDEGVQ
jgi:hypothetical protein